MKKKLLLELIKVLKIKIKEQTKPIMPKPAECCGDSCPNCVWNIYFENLEKWRKS